MPRGFVLGPWAKEDLGLPHLVERFRQNAIDGEMLADLAEEDFVGELGLTKLQAKKIMVSLGLVCASRPCIPFPNSHCGLGCIDVRRKPMHIAHKHRAHRTCGRDPPLAGETTRGWGPSGSCVSVVKQVVQHGMCFCMCMCSWQGEPDAQRVPRLASIRVRRDYVGKGNQTPRGKECENVRRFEYIRVSRDYSVCSPLLARSSFQGIRTLLRSPCTVHKLRVSEGFMGKAAAKCAQRRKPKGRPSGHVASPGARSCRGHWCHGEGESTVRCPSKAHPRCFPCEFHLVPQAAREAHSHQGGRGGKLRLWPPLC